MDSICQSKTTFLCHNTTYFLRMTSISSLWIQTHVPKGKIFVLSSNSSLVENLSCIEVDKSTTDHFVLQILQKENGCNVLSSIKILTVPSYSWLSILLLLFLSSVTFGTVIFLARKLPLELSCSTRISICRP